MPDFQTWSSTVQVRMETALAHFLPTADVAPRRLHEAMRYAVLGGGKRVRPLLAFAAGEVTDAAPERVEIAAAAVEIIHAYSLVHDDMPCMDDDTLRRGRPTVHVQYDEATALLVGDALQSQAFLLLARMPGASPDMVALLAEASGSRGMAGGQAIDCEAVGRQLSLPELEFMHIHKTGALIRASVLMGARCGVADDSVLKTLDRYAKQVGLAFQVVDDVLDAEASTTTLGKTAGKDARQHKPTYVSLLGLEEAKRMAARLHDDAVEALVPLGDGARRLRELAGYIVKRQF